MPWRQGSVISLDDLHTLPTDIPSHCDGGLVISHDCDLANDPSTEPQAEWLSIRFIDEVDGNYEYAKNPRVLHLVIEMERGPQSIEVHASQKRALEKRFLTQLVPVSRPLRDQSLQILQSWLAARYRRHAFPDDLVERMRPLFIFLQKQLKTHARGILGVWLDYEPRLPAAADEPYELWLYLVYTIDDPQGREQAESLAATTRERFSPAWPGVILSDCKAISEEGFTLADLRRNIEFKLEHLSHRIHPQGSFIE